jgi:hypothetical protein
MTHQGNPPRICVGDGNGPEILCIDPDGNRVLLRWKSAAGPVTDGEVREWREANLRLFGEKLREEDIVRMLAQIPVPRVRPDYTEITLDTEWNLWVRSGPTAGLEETAVDHLVFDPNGALLGTVALPPIEVLEIGADYVMGVYRDEMEVESMRIYEIEKPWRASK